MATIVSLFPADLSTAHVKGLSLHVVFMLIPMLHDIGRETHGGILAGLTRLVDGGQIRPLIHPEVFPLDRIADAHRVVETGRALGKVVVRIA